MSHTELLELLRRLGTTDISDALDRFGIAGQCRGIMPLDRSFQLAGRAWTVRYGVVGQGGGTVGDYIDDVADDEVVVLDNAGRTDVTVWGDLLTTTASARRVAGTVIDGVCRDVERSLSLAYPIFSRGNWMRTGKDRVRVEEMQTAVCIGGVRVEPGDWLRGDADGVVVIPAARVEAVLGAACEIQAAEDRIRAALEAGLSLREARKAHGYHTLQSKRD